jgi:hypothetical protein
VVRHTGEALVKAIVLAQAEATPEQAQVVAAECVTLAETKDRLNWELLGQAVDRLTGEPARATRRVQGGGGKKRTSTSTTTRAGLADSGPKDSASPKCCRHLKNRRKSRPPAGLLASSRPDPT